MLQETDLSLQIAIDMWRASELSKRQKKSITEEPKSLDYVNKNGTPDSKFPPKEKKQKNARRRRKVDNQTDVKDVEQFMHRENAQLLEKSVKNARVETTLHLSVFRITFVSWKVIKPLNLLSKTSNKKVYLSAMSRKMTMSKNGKHLFK